MFDPRSAFGSEWDSATWRDPVPDDLVETLQRPLIGVVKGSRPRVALFENFTKWLGIRDDGAVP